MGAMVTLAQRWQGALMNNYGTPPLALVRGRGAEVWDEHGRRYLDLVSGIAVNALGHAHPAVQQAVAAQLAELGHVSNLFLCARPIELAEELQGLLGVPARALFCNSGAEANEAAIKVARRTTGRREVLSMEGGFHGRTSGALSATALGHYLEDYAPLVPDHAFLPFGDLAAAEAAVTDRTAAVLLEPIQSMGGMHSATDGYLQGLRALCDRTGALLCFDEVQTGPARTGRWWYGDAADVTPDLLTTAKGLGSGVPVGALLARDEVAAKVKEGDLGTTFGGGPLASAAVEATLSVIEDERLVENAARRGREISEGVARLPGVVGVRGRGLLLGIVLDRDAKGVVRRLREHAVLTSSTPGDPKVLRIMPPLVVGDEHVEAFLRALRAVLA